MKVGQGIETDRGLWTFGGGVPDTFAEHVLKSVPFYGEGHELICQLSDFFLSTGSVVYDVGCSTGTLLGSLAAHNKRKPGIRFIGIDSTEEMAAAARANCSHLPEVEIICDDAVAHTYLKSDMIVAYYTAQFVRESQRQAFFDRIYAALNWGGALVLFEKVGAPDSRFQDMMSGLYREFKQRNGFSPDEILNKELSLKGVLRPFSTEGNIGLLRRAGFVDYMTIMKYVCFEGFLAIK